MNQAVRHLPAGTVAVVGVPSDENSSFMPGAALAPGRIREALFSDETNLSAENGIDLGTDPRWLDLGDLELDGGSASLEQIERATADLLERGAFVLALGGDHAITYPLLKAYAASYERLNVLHLDAHPDLYDEFEGNRNSHACPFARVMEDKLVHRLVQVGIRTINPHQRQQIDRLGVETIEMRHWQPDFEPEFDGPVYLSLDLDVLDPAFVPGVSHHEPGGLSTRELIRLIQNLDAPLVGADIVELNPHNDLGGMTARVAAKLLKEVVACMIETNGIVGGE